MTKSLNFFKDGTSYEERTYCPAMDGIGYVTDLLNAQERPQHVSMRPSNQMFNKFYKVSQPSKKTKLNKLMNDTLKNSSPQFYVEQQFSTEGKDSNGGRYEFKLDPNFMSCNSVYKTLALRGIYMRPKRYTVNYAAQIQLTTNISPTEIDPTYQPVFHYTKIEMESYARGRGYRDGVHKVEAIITDDQNKAYTVKYEQNYKYNGPKFQDTIPNKFTVSYNGGADYEGKYNKVYGIDVGGGKKVDFEFYPSGLAIITTKYESGGDDYTETLRCEKTTLWDQTSDTCKTAKIIQKISSNTYEQTFPFSITLLPENNIEEFCHLVKEEVNKKLKSINIGSEEEEDEEESHYKQCEIDYEYDSSVNILVFYAESSEPGVNVKMRFVPVDYQHRSEANKFYGILNQSDWQLTPSYEYEVSFENVWNREYFYVHASFMNLVQYNQLGRTGEIYPKPTKLTKYTSSIPEVEFWTSVNGIDPFTLTDQDFEVVLALAATLNNADITF